MVRVGLGLYKYSIAYGWKHSVTNGMSVGRHYSVDWTTGLDYWTGLLDSRKMPLEGKITGL